MILTVTLNPAIDYGLELTALEPGSMHRVRAWRLDAGGKGVNVSRFLAACGQGNTCLSLVGGPLSTWFREELESCGIRCHLIESRIWTRMNVKIHSEAEAASTDLNVQGAPVDQELWQRVQDELSSLCGKGDRVLLSGSLPPGLPDDAYATLGQIAVREGAILYLDAEGQALRHGLHARPHMIKPNLQELEGWAGRRLPDRAAWRDACHELLQTGIDAVLLSLGKDGAYFCSEHKEAMLPSSPVKVESTVGAGDAMMAGFILGEEKGLNLDECLELALAAAETAVQLPGTSYPDLARIRVALGRDLI